MQIIKACIFCETYNFTENTTNMALKIDSL